MLQNQPSLKTTNFRMIIVMIATTTTTIPAIIMHAAQSFHQKYKNKSWVALKYLWIGYNEELLMRKALALHYFILFSALKEGRCHAN